MWTKLGTALCVVGVWFSVVARTEGALSIFTDPLLFESAAPPLTTIDFVGLTEGEVVTNQYSGLGITFSERTVNEEVLAKDITSFVNDHEGITHSDHSAAGAIVAYLAPEVFAFGVYHPGHLDMDLFDCSGDPIGSASGPGPGTGFFLGVVSTKPIMRADIYDHFNGSAFVDDIVFGVPEPATVLLLGLGGLALLRKRKK